MIIFVVHDLLVEEFSRTAGGSDCQQIDVINKNINQQHRPLSQHLTLSLSLSHSLARSHSLSLAPILSTKVTRSKTQAPQKTTVHVFGAMLVQDTMGYVGRVILCTSRHRTGLP